MATLRREQAPARAPRTAVTVPPEFRLGPLAEVWSDTGHPTDLGSAFGRHSAARLAWEQAEHLDTATACNVAPRRGGPWSLATYHAEGRAAAADDRLARAGVTRADLPRLRRAAEARTRTIDPSRRTT